MRQYIAVALLLITACTAGGNVAIEKEKLCAILPLSGDWALWGQEYARGLELAAEEHDMLLILEDDAYEKTKTVTAGQKLLHDNCPAVVVPFIESARPIIPFFEQSDVPVVALLDRTKEVEAFTQLYSVGYSVEDEGRMMAEYAYEKGDRAAVIYVDNIEYTIILADAFKERFEELGGNVIEKKTLAPGDDFLTLVTRIKAEDPDVVYTGFIENDYTAFLKRSHEQKIRGRILAADSLTPDIVAAAGVASEGVCKSDVPFEETPAVVALLARYEKKYGEEPAIPPWVILGHDAGNVVARNEDLTILTYTSVNGEAIRLKEVSRTKEIFCVQDGELVLEELL